MIEDQLRVEYPHRGDIQRRYGGTSPALGPLHPNTNNINNNQPQLHEHNNSSHTQQIPHIPANTNNYTSQQQQRNNLTSAFEKAFGHTTANKTPNTIRLAGWNVNTFPVS